MANNELSAEQKCKYGHSYASHGGLTNPCMHRDPCAQAGLGAYDCDCDMYEPTTPQPSAEPAQDGAEKVSDDRRVIECKSEEGILIGLLDSIMTAATVATARLNSFNEDVIPEAVLEACSDLFQDSDLRFLISFGGQRNYGPNLELELLKAKAEAILDQRQSAPQEPEGEQPLPVVTVSDVPDLYRLAYMPGVWRCPMCEFQLSKQTISMSQGEIGTTEKDRQSEECPNDGTWMVPVTYREALAAFEKRCFEEIERANGLEAQLTQAKKERDGVKDVLREMAWHHGSVHDDECPQDDTCRCSQKPFNDRVNAACGMIVPESLTFMDRAKTAEAEASTLRAQVERWKEFGDEELSKSAALGMQVEELRKALIESGRAAGCLLAESVSTEFIIQGVPHEVKARIAELEGKR